MPTQRTMTLESRRRRTESRISSKPSGPGSESSRTSPGCRPRRVSARLWRALPGRRTRTSTIGGGTAANPPLSRHSRQTTDTRRRPAAAWRRRQVVEDLPHDRRVHQEGDHPHPAAALGAGQRINLVDAADQLCPRAPEAPTLGGPGLGNLRISGDLLGPLDRRPSCAGDVGIVTVIADLVERRLGNVLQQPGEELGDTRTSCRRPSCPGSSPGSARSDPRGRARAPLERGRRAE